MLLLTSIVGTCVCASLIWFYFVVSCIAQNKINSSYIVTLMGLFLPFVVIGFGVGFVYLATELKKTQRHMEKVLKQISAKKTQPIETKPKEESTENVLHISMDDPINKYAEVTLPEDVSLRFEK